MHSLFPSRVPNVAAMGGVAQSLAAALLGSNDGIAVFFNDNFYQSTTGFYGSMRIRDSVTPANDYDNSPRSSGTDTKIANTASSLKTVRQSDGYLDFAPHNMALRSADISNASWGKVGTATAGSATLLNLPAANDRIQQTMTAANVAGRNLILSAVLSGTAGATMTLTIDEDGTETNQQITLTATATRYSVSRSIGDTPTTVRIWIERNAGDTATSATVTEIQAEVSWHRTTPGPYIATTSAIVYSLPFEWDTSGGFIGARIEEARTNLCLRNCDLTNAAWTATNMTTARTATGPNNRANFATTLTATAGNATVLQSITDSSRNRRTGCWIKRRTGTGNIDLTQDNGATWTTVTVTNDWTLVQTANATVTNPVVGIRIVTSGDAVDVCFFMHESPTSGNIDAITSPIYTVAANATRAVDNFQTAISSFMTLGTECTVYGRYIPLTTLKLPSGGRTAFSVAATSSNSINVGLRSSGVDDIAANVASGGLGTASFSSGTINTTTGNKTAVAVATNDAEGVADGVSLGAADTSTGVPTGATPTHLVYGGDGTTIGTPLNGWIVAVMVRPVRMSQADMISLTT